MDSDPITLLLLIPWMGIFQICNILLLLFFSALVSGSEVAFFSLSANELKNEANKTQLFLIKKLLQQPKKLLATILITNNFINIAIVLLLSAFMDAYFKILDRFLWDWFPLRFLIEVVVATFLILLFGEILPKVYANRNPMQFAVLMAKPLSFLHTILTPFSLPMYKTTEAIHEKLGKQRSNISVDQLSKALELTSDVETSIEEKKILKGIVTFGNTDTKQVMRPRVDIFALPSTASFPEILTEIIQNGYSRIPVYTESLDHIIGILYSKDLLPYIHHKQYNWNTLLRTPYFVPENKKLDDLLNDFKTQKKHLAIVVDEYGGTSGLLSLEDIIEEIVGDIRNEFDDEDIIYSKLDNKNYVFDGRTALKDFYKIIKMSDPILLEQAKGEAETIAGLVLETSGKFPKVGEVVRIHNFEFKIETLDNRRIKQIKFTWHDS